MIMCSHACMIMCGQVWGERDKACVDKVCVRAVVCGGLVEVIGTDLYLPWINIQVCLAY